MNGNWEQLHRSVCSKYSRVKLRKFHVARSVYSVANYNYFVL